MGNAVRELASQISIDARMVGVLRRCRAALDPGDAGWEMDVGTAVERDAALVKDLDALLDG